MQNNKRKILRFCRSYDTQPGNEVQAYYTAPTDQPTSRRSARDISLPLSEIYCTYHVTDSTHTAASGLLPLLVRPPGLVFRTLTAIRTLPKLLSGTC